MDDDILLKISEIDEMTNIFVLVNEIVECRQDLRSDDIKKAFKKNPS